MCAPADTGENHLAKALRDFKGDTQPGYDPSRADVLYSISEAPTLDLAYYLARLR